MAVPWLAIISNPQIFHRVSLKWATASGTAFARWQSQTRTAPASNDTATTRNASLNARCRRFPARRSAALTICCATFLIPCTSRLHAMPKRGADLDKLCQAARDDAANSSHRGAIVNSYFKATVDLAGLQALFEVLKARGYRLVGPRVRDGAIVYDDLASINALPMSRKAANTGCENARTARCLDTPWDRIPGRNSCFLP
jgi:hypothetical protein